MNAVFDAMNSLITSVICAFTVPSKVMVIAKASSDTLTNLSIINFLPHGWFEINDYDVILITCEYDLF